MTKHLLLTLALLSTLAFTAEDKPKPKTPAGPPKKNKCETMEYGPLVTATWGEGKDNFANKGVAVRVSKDPLAYMVFDTETLRVSAAWKNGFMDYQGLAYIHNWGKARGPNAKGEIEFSTKPGPGWADANGSFKDPRPTTAPDGPLPKEWAKYHGLYLNGERVIFSYSVNGCEILETFGLDADKKFTRTFNLGASTKPLKLMIFDEVGFSITDGKPIMQTASKKFLLKGRNGLQMAACLGASPEMQWEHSDQRLVLTIPPLAKPTAFTVIHYRNPDPESESVPLPALTAPIENLEPLTHGGALRWGNALETKGALGKDDSAYTVDTITPPDDNPWQSWLRFGGLDFFSDGRAALSTWSGDVWIVSGLDDKLDHVQWKRFATGLFQPLGVKIVNDELYVLAHGQIIKLQDLNKDGEADFYENFNSDCAVTPNYHEFAMCLETDADGNFYFLKGAPALAGRNNFERFSAQSGCLVKVSKDGQKIESIASGFREPNGLCISPSGDIFTTDNQGNWMPECPLSLIQKGGFYGMVDPSFKGTPPKRAPTLNWLPYNIDNSTGAGIWETSTKWGPLQNQMLLTSYGKCQLLHVMFDRINDKIEQAAVARFPFTFASGVMRGRFHPKDGQLYLTGLKGWGCAAVKDGCFQRVRYTGKPANFPLEYHTTKTGARIVFTDKLDAESVNDTGNVSVNCFNVVATKDYGSKEFWISNPKKEGREPFTVKSVKLQPDGKTVELEIEKLQPVNNLVVKVKWKAADGSAVSHEIDASINKLP